MSQTQEFVVRVPRESSKRFHVMRFASENVEISRWKQTQMKRENNVNVFSAQIDSPSYGAGSEFGKKQKEEAKKKRFMTNIKKYNAREQPWLLKVGGKPAKKYKGIREGGVSENASYYVFFQAHDGAFEAFPINEWYNFTPIQRYKALTAEEAEEKFEKRDKILNYFSVMMNKKRKDEDGGETSETKSKIKKEFKVSDMDDWHDNDSEYERDDDFKSDDEMNNKKKPKINKKKTANKKKKNSDDEEDVEEESDEGDFDDKELDYISDSSSSSEEENEKTNRELKGVEDEDALRQLVISDEEDEEENKDNNEKESTENPNNLENDKTKPKIEKTSNSNIDSPPPSSSDSDSDNSDLDESKSALFMQKKIKMKNESDQSATSSRAATPTSNLESHLSNDSNKLKRKLLTNDGVYAKKQKYSNESQDGITEEAVRRYLMRKPMTCTDLLQKFKNKVSVKSDLVHTIAQILKRINPEKQTIKNKTYLSLKPS